MEQRSYTIRVPRRWVRIAMIMGASALVVAPLTAVATHTFDDVPASNTFHADIEWLDAAGVTKGCNPPANNEFCPDDNVTRGQMSAFMRRLAQYIGAEDGTPAQADNASTLDGMDSGQFLQECSAGSIGAWAKILVSQTTAALDTAGVTDSYACTGTDVLVARISAGIYALVVDGGSGSTIGQTSIFGVPVASSAQNSGTGTFSISGPFQLNPGAPPFWVGWSVHIRDNAGTNVDQDFSVLIPARGSTLASLDEDSLPDAPPIEE